MKYLFPILFSIPTVLTWLFLFVRLSGNHAPAWGVWVVGLSFLSLCACIAMSMVTPEAKAWRIAAIFNSIPFVLMVVVLLVIPLD